MMENIRKTLKNSPLIKPESCCHNGYYRSSSSPGCLNSHPHMHVTTVHRVASPLSLRCIYNTFPPSSPLPHSCVSPYKIIIYNMPLITNFFPSTRPLSRPPVPISRTPNTNTMRASNQPFPELKLTDTSRHVIQQHLDQVGYEGKKFDQTDMAQSEFSELYAHLLPTQISAALVAEAFALFGQLGLYIPQELHRPANSKLVIVKSQSRRVGSKTESPSFMRWTRIYQCMCGIEDEDPGMLAGIADS